MSLDAQTILTLMLITWALGYVAWRGWRNFRHKPSGTCGGCAKCPAETNSPAGLVQLEPLQPTAHRRGSR
jgi:hypothetical protein